MKSLSRRFLISVGLMSLIMTVLGTFGAFVVFERELSNRQIGYLTDYVRERSSNVDRQFSNLSTLHQAAGEELQRRMDKLSDAEVAKLADAYFPLQADGTRRSRDKYFDGVLDNGDYTYGLGALLTSPKTASPQEMRALVAAFRLVSDFGQAARRDYDTLYFFTPDPARLVMYAPDRADRLMYYRHEAPADFSVAKEEMARLTLPQFDPSRATRCTNLQRLVQDTVGKRLSTACLTPAYVNGRYVGAFGSSMELTHFFLSALKNTPSGASPMIVTSKGELIAYPGFTDQTRSPEKTLAAYEKKFALTDIVARAATTGQDNGVIESRDGRQIVAFGRLSGPNWYLLLTYPKANVMASALSSASWVLLIGGIASAIQALAVVLLARSSIVRPVERLAASCEPGADERVDVSDVERRKDEIGVLAISLRTEREKTEAVLASLEDRVSERTAQLERANTEKSRFLANMSHELRTPLNGVIAISETLAGQQSTPKGRELAELIVASGRLLERVLTDILDFSKIEAGEITLARDDFSMERLVGHIAELHRASALGKGLDFRWAVTADAVGHYAGDTVRLTQVLSNLLSNAVKFTEAGEVVLEVIAFGDEVRFQVSDSGIGFDEETGARLFRRFEQADASIRRRFGGTGLGLAISRSLVELMGGRIVVQSTPGQGSVFSVYVPLERLADGESVEGAEAGPELDIVGCRVLVAEDHPTNQKVVELILESVGVIPTIVENGRLALELLKTERFDVVLMDMQMPELDGLSATALLREWERETGAARTPVIMLTANALDDHIRASHDAGADLHLSKPIHAQALIESILNAIAAQPSAGAQAAEVA
ncbi:MAG TPA: ATP-binding protein [Phenylobacterium sp.]|jgi:signal transduction histidine kinase/CheY-like chemotaxis protein|uniref:ATP-binding protein n=1 Tax=Phenylobacterium sp. TaxID=1871053 RepID=UPI002C38748B|nr:ATP-binding protein [Phenylobacterium sp.]HXA41191.1 ATP-binding protein [Phenylobacterium sp.]